RIRIGYVSSDFGNHPVSHLMHSVFGLHDASKFEVFCYSLRGNDGSKWYQTVSQNVEHFKTLPPSISTADAAKLIYADKIHILVNLNGYTDGNRNDIFALQPAPIQMVFLGFIGSMAANWIQYLVTDKIATPEEF